MGFWPTQYNTSIHQIPILGLSLLPEIEKRVGHSPWSPRKQSQRADRHANKKIKSCTMKRTVHSLTEYLPRANRDIACVSCSLCHSPVMETVIILTLQMRDWGSERQRDTLRVIELGNGRSMSQQGRKRQLRLGKAGKTSRSRKSLGWALKNKRLLSQ